MRLLLPALLIAFPAAAQNAADPSRTVDQLGECRAIIADAERLSCFDRLAERIVIARRSGELLVLDRKKVVERKRAGFGLASTSGELFGGGEEDRATEVKELDTTIKVAAPAAAFGRWNLQLANGMVWQTVDTLSYPPKSGAPIKLKTASLGGFRASINGRSYLVKRLR